MAFAERNADDEGGAFAGTAFRANGAAVLPDQLLDQRETDAAPLVGAAPGVREAMEALEQTRHVLRRYADAGVADTEFGGPVPRSQSRRRSRPRR